MRNISLAIIAYNQDYHLIYSLLNEFSKQTMAPSEIVFYCSGIPYLTDIPENIIISNTSVPIYTIFNKKRTIQAVARNVCAKISSSDIIIFFDIDDIPHPKKLEITNNIFSQNKIDFLLHNYNTNINFTDSLDTKLSFDLKLNPSNTNLICENFPIHHAHIAVKKEVFTKIQFNESIEYYRKEDGKFCQDLLNNNYIGCYYHGALVYYSS